MWITIDNLKPLAGAHEGQLWILTSYWPGGLAAKAGIGRLSREQCHTRPVFAETRLAVDATGKLTTLDGRAVAAGEVTEADAAIGFEIEVVHYSAAEVCAQIRRAAEAFIPAFLRAKSILADIPKRDARAVISGRTAHLERLVEYARAAKEPALSAQCEAKLSARRSANRETLEAELDAEMGKFRVVVQEASQSPSSEGFVVDAADTRGLMAVPEIAAMIGSGWEV